MANARPPTKVNRNSGKGQAPAAPQVAPPFAAPPAVGPAPGVAVPRLEPTLPEGLRLGAFEIKGVISQSRAAVVYRVSDHSLGIPAAIKEYMPVGVARRGNGHQVVALEAWHEDTIDLGRRAFFAESRALARCDDPALLRVTQLWEINGTAYRVMPLYSGKRLVDLRRDMKAPIDETALRAMLERLLDALGAYHASAGVHGNVTPMNILMPALDRPVLLGPGKSSMLLAAELGESTRSDFEAAFAAPEQHEAADAAVIGPAADLFGLAQTLRYAITGSAPIGHESLRASIHRLLGAGAVSNYSDALLDALSSATATAPAERPQSLDEFRHLLRRLEAQSAALAAPAPAPVQAPQARAAAPVPPLPATAAQIDPLEEEVDETIDVSSMFGDRLPEPHEPERGDETVIRHRPAPAPDPRLEPTLNFAFGSPVPPVHEPFGHGTHADHAATAAHASHVHVEHPNRRDATPTAPHGAPHTPHTPPHAPPYAPPHVPPHMPAHGPGEADPLAGADAHADREAAYHASMYGDATAERIAASFRPKRSLLASPVLRMSAFVIAIAALAIVVILAVSGVWDPRGPQLDLPPTASPGGGTALPSTAPAPAPTAELPASAEPSAAPITGTDAPKTEPAPAAAAPGPAAAPTTEDATAATAPPARESNSARRRGAAAETAGDPRQACAGRTQFALYRCMQAQCAMSRWAAHPECVRLRRSDRVDPP